MAKVLVERDVLLGIYRDDSVDHATAGDMATEPPTVRIQPGSVVLVDPPVVQHDTDHPVWDENSEFAVAVAEVGLVLSMLSLGDDPDE